MAVSVLRATGAGSLEGDVAGLAVDADGPAATANLLAVALAGHAALGVGELGRADELVAAVALATVLGSSDGEALADTVGNALLVGHGAKVGQDVTGQNTADVVLVAAGVGVSTDGGGSVALGARSRGRGGSGARAGDGDGLGDGVDVGASALRSTTSRQRGGRRSSLGGLGAGSGSSLGG